MTNLHNLDQFDAITLRAFTQALTKLDFILSDTLNQKIKELGQKLSSEQSFNLTELIDEIVEEDERLYGIYMEERIILQDEYESTHRTKGNLDDLTNQEIPSYLQNLETDFNFLSNYNLSNSQISKMNESQTQTYYTDISCPRRVWVKEKRFQVVVRLTLNPSEYSENIQELKLNSEDPVRVRLETFDFTILNQAEQEIDIKPNQDSYPIVFDLQPCEEKIGDRKIELTFFQNGHQISDFITLNIEITEFKIDTPNQEQQNQLKGSNFTAPPPDIRLDIRYDKESNKLWFNLTRNGSIGYHLPPVQLENSLEIYAQNLYQKLDDLIKPNASRISKQKSNIPANIIDNQIAKRIKKLGNDIWDKLIPEELQKIYGEDRNNWYDKTFLLVTDDPYIPWEITLPFSSKYDYQDENPWCLTFKMTRWLCKNNRGDGNEFAPLNLSLQNFACFAPNYKKSNNSKERLTNTELPFAQQEKQFLQQLITQHNCQDISPELAHLEDVLAILENSNYTWLHFASHGNFNQEIPDDPAIIHLEANSNLTINEVVGYEIERHILKTRPSFFLNACHGGKQTLGIKGLSGWANHLITKGAGLIINPQWKVDDKLAYTFALVFYQELLKNKTVAEAIREARLTIKNEIEPTWLAYSVYGHPNAKIN